MFAILFAATTLQPQLPPPSPKPLIGARSLALSPDGSRLAFSYQGDIWIASSKGGRAIPITNHIEMEDNPIWSPDGQWIAFASNRTGNWDTFIVPADGGQVRRLTWNSGSDVPSDWSADGKTLLERTSRDDPNNGIYGIDVETGRTKQYFLDMMPIGSPKFSGGSIVYTRFGFPWVRARYQGSAASQLWRYDVAAGKRIEIRNNGFQHLWPGVGSDGTIYTVTVSEKTPATTSVGKSIGKNVDNVQRTPNVYAIGGNGSARRLTNFVGAPVRFLTVASKSSELAFEDDGDVYTMEPGGQPQKITLIASLDDKTTMEERLTFGSTGVRTASLSPSGDRWVFSIMGELWMVPTKKGKGPNADDATQLTDWAGLDELPLWMPDGKTIFFTSDREGAQRLYKMAVDTKAVSPVCPIDSDVVEMRIAPDKKTVSFWLAGSQGGLYTVNADGTGLKRVLAKPGEEPDYDWSPDMRYVAYRDTLVGSGYYYWEAATNIHIFDTTTGKSVDVTKLSVPNSTPRFSADGRFLYFQSSRSGNAGTYVLPLRAEDARTTELELKFEKPAAPVKTDIDFDGIEDRARRFIAQPAADLASDPTNGDVWFTSDGDVWKASYSGEDVRRITNGVGVGGFEFTGDGNGLAYVGGTKLYTTNIRNPQFPTAQTTFRADWVRDLRLERQAAFDEFWRAYNRGFYDPNFHGRDWVALKKRYEKYLPSVGHRNEIATVLNMMVGELESSHSEVGPGPGNPSGSQTAHLGFTIDYSFDGPGLKIKDVPARTPGSYAKTKLSAGEIVTQVNGKDVAANEALAQVLNDQVGRDLTLTVKAADGKTRTVKYRALSGGEFGGIVFNNRLDARRKYVETKSDGKVTYVHIAGMGDGELQRFMSQVWEYAQGKQGLIIDVRNNGGGNTSDRIIDILERRPNAYYAPRDQQPFFGPGQALTIPMVVMCAETSYSNAEMFPSAMKSRKLATIVGMPTPGYVIYTYGLRLVDGTNARMPGAGTWRLDGTPLENMGQQPDYKVDITPADYFAGRDPQLDKAIEVLVKQKG